MIGWGNYTRRRIDLRNPAFFVVLFHCRIQKRNPAYEKIKHRRCRRPEWDRPEISSFQPTTAGSLRHQSDHSAECANPCSSAARAGWGAFRPTLLQFAKIAI